MPRKNYSKWRTAQDIGIRTRATLPAWEPDDLVEIIGTGLQGKVTRCTTLDMSIWEIEMACPCGGWAGTERKCSTTHRFITTHANNLRLVIPPVSTCPLHPDAIGKVEGCIGCRYP